jgi:conjugal transfer ATP-binding protein TraC
MRDTTHFRMFSRVKDILFGTDRTPTVPEMENELKRSSFSQYLPFVAFDPDRDIYINVDDTHGVIYECVPLYFAGETALNSLEGIFTMGIPAGSILQLILYADPYIDPILRHYGSLKRRQNPLLAQATESYIHMLQKGVRGMDIFQRTPIRNFRLFVALKIPSEHASGIESFSHSLKEKLKGANLNPRSLPPEELLAFMRQIFNTTTPGDLYRYNPDIPLNKQIILSESAIAKTASEMTINDRHFKCLTVKSFPMDVSAFETNEIFGGVWGIRSDDSQMLTPFSILSTSYSIL